VRPSRRAFLASSLAAAVLKGQALPYEWTGVKKVVSVGDVHGDLDAFRRVLAMAGLIDKDGAWTGGQTHLVQIGDVPARGPQTKQAFEYMMALEPQVAAAGGRFHALIGNHEAMVMYGDLRGVLPEEFAAFATPDSDRLLKLEFEKDLAEDRQQKRGPATPDQLELYRADYFRTHPPGYVEYRRAFAANGPFGQWIRGHNSVIRIDDTLYLHAGIAPEYLTLTAPQINQTIRKELADPAKLPPGLCTNTQGPVWYRGFSEGNETELAPLVDKVLKNFGVRRIVIGHSVTRTAIMPRFGSRVIDIDIGLSRFYGRPPACLVIENGVASILFRGTSLPVPGPSPADRLSYLRAVTALDTQPSPIEDLIAKLSGTAG
jgi:hypothetical protein